MQLDVHAEPITLGFPVVVEPNYLYSLRSQYLPLGKIGGKPSWLNPVNIPSSEKLECKICKKPMCFLVQLYATSNDDPVHSFHRTLYIFICRSPECSKTNDPSNIVAFRCVLPRSNEYYSFDGPMDPDLDGDVPNPRLPASAPHLCEICGCFATKKCGKCTIAWYCSREHQVIDWTTGHKLNCCKSDADRNTAAAVNPANPFLFKEYGVCLDNEYIPGNLLDDISDDEDGDGEDSDDETEDDRNKRLQDFQKFVDSQKEKNSDITVADAEAAVSEQKKDDAFERFSRLISLNPDQIVRYKRYGDPLPATDRALPLPTPEDIPSCDICGSPRRFEFQITPHLLSLMEVDSIGQSIDFASVYIYTCMRSCEVPEQDNSEMNKRKCSSLSGGSRQKGGHTISLVYFLGFSDTEIAEFKKKAQREVEFTEKLTSNVTHIIFNDKSAISEISNYITKLFYAAISGSWVIRPGWLLGDSPESNFALAANNLEYMFSKSNSTNLLQEILKLCEFYATSKIQIFKGPIFQKVLFLQSANDDEESDVQSDLKSILEASGASFVRYNVVRNLKLKGKNDNFITIAISFTKNADILDKSLLKLLLDAGVPVIFYETFLDYIKQKREPELSELLETSQNLWSFDHLHEIQPLSNSSMMSTTELYTADNSRQNSSENFSPLQSLDVWLNCQPVFDSWMDYMNITPHCEMIMKIIKDQNEKTFYQSVESINNFAQIISEFELNTTDKEVSSLICYSAVSYLTNSEKPLFLPTPTAVSFLFHKIIEKDDCYELLDTKTTAFTYIKCLIQKYPPRNSESRLYWIKALASTERNDDDEFKKTESDVREILRNIRALLEKIFKQDPVNEDVIAILLEILEIDLYFFETGYVDGPSQMHTVNKLKNMELLLTNPLAYLVVDDLGYAYGRGLDKRSKEFLMAASRTASSLAENTRYIHTVTRLHMVFLEAIYFTRQQGENEANIRDDLSSVLRRMIQYGVKKNSLYEFYPCQWIHNILRSIR